MSRIVLLRFASARLGAASYFAVPAGREHEAIAVFTTTTGGEIQAETVPWDTLPGAEPHARAALAGHAGDRRYVILGTCVEGTWTAWEVPDSVPPAVPPGCWWR